MSSSVLYVGMKGRVTAIDKSHGGILWQSHLKGSSFVTLLIEDGRIFAHTHGELFCLDAATGAVLWENGLPGLGYDLASLATASRASELPPAARQRQQQAASSANATGTGH